MKIKTLKSAVNNKKNWSLTIKNKEFSTFYILNKGNDCNHIFESLFFGNDSESESELLFIETYSQKNGIAKKGIKHSISLENSIQIFA